MCSRALALRTFSPDLTGNKAQLGIEKNGERTDNHRQRRRRCRPRPKSRGSVDSTCGPSTEAPQRTRTEPENQRPGTRYLGASTNCLNKRPVFDHNVPLHKTHDRAVRDEGRSHHKLVVPALNIDMLPRRLKEPQSEKKNPASSNCMQRFRSFTEILSTYRARQSQHVLHRAQKCKFICPRMLSLKAAHEDDFETCFIICAAKSG